MRAVALKNRTVIFHCRKCRDGQACQCSLASLREALLGGIREELIQFSRMIATEVETRVNSVSGEIAILRESNIQLVNLLASHPSYSCAALASSSCDGGVSAGPPGVIAGGTGETVRLSLTGGPTGLHSVGPPSLPASLPASKSVAFARTSGNLSAPGSRGLDSGKQVLGPKSAGDSSAPAGQSAARKAIMGSRKLQSSTISAANIPKKTSVFVSKLDRQVTADDLHLYLKSTFGNDQDFVVEEQKVRTGEYRAFRVRAGLELLSDLLSSSNWPEGVLIKKFHFFRSRPTASSQKQA